MVKFKQALLAILGFLSIFSQNSIYSYVCGYTQLVSPNGKQRIDLIYDFHIPCKYANPNRLWINSCHNSEKAVYNCLKKLDKSSKDKIDLLWESHEEANPRNGLFISHAKTLKKELSNKINLINSDLDRFNFEKQMLSIPKHTQKVKNNTKFCRNCGYFHSDYSNFITQPIKRVLGCIEEVSKNIFSSIVSNLGLKPANSYKRKFNSNRKKLKSLMPYAGNIEKEFLLDNQNFHEIADIEMLGNILASDKPRIMVYAGCFHCLALKDELKALGYKTKKSIEQKYTKVRPKQMKSEKINLFLS